MTDSGGSPGSDRAELRQGTRKSRDRSIILLIVGVCLLMPPLGDVFLLEGDLLGVPIPLLYVFTVWLLLIVGAVFLARPLQKSDAGKPVDITESED